MENISPHSPAGYVKDTGTPKGRGMFASRTLEAGEVIEVCPMVKLATRYNELPAEIRKIVFDWGVLAGMHGVSALALGFGSLYNHANPANARYKASSDGECLVISADRKIGQDEEITINYNCTAGEPRSTQDNWFTERGVELYVATSGPANHDD